MKPDHRVRPGEDVLERLIVLPVAVLAGLDTKNMDEMLPARLRADLRRFAADTGKALEDLDSLGRLGELATLACSPASVLTDPNVAETLAELPADKLAALADRAAVMLADLPTEVLTAVTALPADSAVDTAALSARMALREAELVGEQDGGWAWLDYELSARTAAALASLPSDKREVLRRLGTLPAAGLGEWGSTPMQAARRLDDLTDVDISLLKRLVALDSVQLTTLRMLGRRGHAARLEALARLAGLPDETLAALHRLGVLDAEILPLLRQPLVMSHRANQMMDVTALIDLADVPEADLHAVSELTMRAGTPNAVPDTNTVLAVWLLGGLGDDVLHRLSELSAADALDILSANDPTCLSAEERAELGADELSGRDPAGSIYQLAALRRLHVHRGGLEDDTMDLLRRMGAMGERTIRTLTFQAKIGTLDGWGVFNNALDQGGLPDNVRAELIARACTTLAAGYHFSGLANVWSGIRPLAVASAMLGTDGHPTPLSSSAAP